MVKVIEIGGLLCCVVVLSIALFNSKLDACFQSSSDSSNICGDGEQVTASALLRSVSKISQKTIIFDIAGVLLHPSKKFLIWEVGLTNLLWYGITHFKNPFSIFETAIFRFLCEIRGKSDKYFYKAFPLPEVICMWQRGEINCQQIREEALAKIEEWQAQKRFASDMEADFVQTIINLVFTPETFAQKSLQRIERGINVLKAFAARRDAGEGLKIYILSNFEKETLEEVKKLHSDVFDLFDGIAISGEAGVLKPEHAAFEKVIQQFDLDPADCFFIDDQEENVKAALEMGMRAVHFCET